MFFNMINNDLEIVKKHINSNLIFKLDSYDFILNKMKSIYESNNEEKIIELDKTIKNAVLLNKLIALPKSNNIIKYLFNRFNYIKDLDMSAKNYLIIIARYGCISIFELWLNLLNYENIDELEISYKYAIILNSAKNHSLDLYKYILDKFISKYSDIYEENNELIKKLIYILYSSINISKKNFLIKFKLLSNIINLLLYTSYIIKIIDIKMIMKTQKYYYKYYNFNDLYIIINKYEFLENKDKFYYTLKTEEEKITFNLIYSLINNEKITFNYKINYYIDNKLEKISHNLIDNINKNNYELLLNDIICPNLYKQNNYLLILDNLKKNNLIILFLNKHINNKCIHPYLFLLTRFYTNSSISNLYKYNFLLHYLRMFVKKKINNKILDVKLKMNKVLHSLLNFKPDKTKSVLKFGSIKYQSTKQYFTFDEPRHLLPGEIKYYDNYLLQEKSEGIFIKKVMQTNIYPIINEINHWDIKCEYIESIDLYLIYDIDIPNLTYYERYSFLRSSHPYTKDNINFIKIKTFDDFKNIYINEKQILNKFLDENQLYPVKWFPKFTTINNTSNDLQLFIQEFYNYQKNYNNKLLEENNPYIHGIILKPFNSYQEIKIINHNNLYINLLYKDNKLIDFNNNIYENIKLNIECYDNCIYKCVYKNNMFEIIEYLYNINKPDTFKTIDTVINILKYDWSLEFKNMKNDIKLYYYEISNYNIPSKMMNYLIKSFNILEFEIFDKLECKINKNWLDLGCSKGTLLKNIEKFKFNYYLGIDIDIGQLIIALANNNDNNFYPCNLNEDWLNYEIKWMTFNENIIYDYVIATFSLMHFMTDTFWLQLNKYTKTGTKFIFNLVMIDIVDKESTDWSYNNSFLKIENNITKYKFEWVHNNIKEEPYIDNNLLNYFLNKYNWSIQHTYRDEEDFCKLYKWFIIIKN